MSCGDEHKEDRKEGEENKRFGASRVADDSVEQGRESSETNGTNTVPVLELDGKLLINPRLLFIGSKIGEGAHGKVYEGKYGDRIVAIKVLNGGNTPEEKATLESRFIREVNMMSRVTHENLVKFIGACKDPYMVIASELLPGMSLKKYLSSIRPRQLDLHIAIGYALDIARAMDCLHANGIIHRDLKPDNLLLTANQRNVKLVDFGLAREETVTEMMTAETGTYRWMAPELYSTVTLCRGEKKHYTNKVDVYSFGIVLWELLTNRMPFEGMSNLQAAYAAAFKQVRPVLPEDTPQELMFIVQSCWVEDPNMRPSFNQIIRMLNSFLFTLPSPSPEPEAAPVVPSNRTVITTTSSPRNGRKLSFLRQLFAAKRRGWRGSDTQCHLCLDHAESVEYLFVTCTEAQKIWRHYCPLFGTNSTPCNIQDLWGQRGGNLGKQLRKEVKAGWQLMIMAITWSIWCERNQRCFCGKRRVFSRIISGIDFLMLSWFDAAHTAKKQKLVPIESIIKRSLAQRIDEGEKGTGLDEEGEDTATVTPVSREGEDIG